MLRLGPSFHPLSRHLSYISKLNPGPDGLSVNSAFKGVNHDFASTAPKERRHVRLPILINGAGPAGLILAIGLKNAKIPFEICERHRHDLQSRPRRNHVSMLSRYIFKPLKDFLRVPTYQSFLNDDIAIHPLPLGAGDARKHDHSIHTESFLEMLRQHVPVNYGFRLEREGISTLESVVTSNYIAGQTVRTFQGSLLVGADGLISPGNALRVNTGAFSLTRILKLGKRSAFGPGPPLPTRRPWSSL